VALALVALVVAVAEAGYHHYGGYGGKDNYIVEIKLFSFAGSKPCNYVPRDCRNFCLIGSRNIFLFVFD
jgi:hypothetical protein